MPNTLLSLRPLDLVEISSKDVIKEARYFSRMNMGASIDTPYWFFQRIDSDGAIVVASPSGYTEKIDATDISNVIRTGSNQDNGYACGQIAPQAWCELHRRGSVCTCIDCQCNA